MSTTNISQFTEAGLIQAVQHASSEQEHPLSRSDFERISGISQHHIYRLFPHGGWSKLKERAGLPKHPRHHQRLGDHEILSELHSVASEFGHIPTWTQFSNRAQISADVLRRRFGGREGVSEAYREWLKQNEPRSSLLQQLGESSQQMPPPSKAASPETVPVWAKGDGAQYGAPIDFRGLRHAPINEQGVVFLFGMVSRELGFLVEAVHASFPDCEAKRIVDSQNSRWQRVRIEFEFKSRTFKDHGHDPAKCDLIVCWQHNWPECPIDVVELSTVIEEMSTVAGRAI